jgi:hypothetical protein
MINELNREMEELEIGNKLLATDIEKYDVFKHAGCCYPPCTGNLVLYGNIRIN